MKHRATWAATAAATVAVVIGLSGPALAYVGPGAGLGAIGAALGLLAAVVMAVGVILFWPIRRLLRRIKRKQSVEAGGADSAEASESAEAP